MAPSLSDQPRRGFSSADLARVTAETFVERVDFHREVPSTSDLALELARQQEGPCPLLVLTDVQTAGRGRGANVWWAEQGALTFSLVLETEKAQLPPRQWPRVSLTAGLAVSEAIDDLLEGQATRLKWPNDVYLQGRKVCGVLTEVPSNAQGKLVLGIGVNVNNAAVDVSEKFGRAAVALCEVAGRSLCLTTVLIQILCRLAERLGCVGSHDEELLQQWRRRCLLTGRAIQIDVGSRQVAGVCHGIDDEGALVIQTEDKIERCFSGVVSQF